MKLLGVIATVLAGIGVRSKAGLSRRDRPVNLRGLNEKYAGEHGVITVKDGQFVHSANGQPVRFWAVKKTQLYRRRFRGPPRLLRLQSQG